MSLQRNSFLFRLKKFFANKIVKIAHILVFCAFDQFLLYMKNIAILASGSGSNAENIINFFSEIPDISVSLIISNKKDAFVHERAKKLQISSVTFSKKDFEESDIVLDYLKKSDIDFIVLAGFLLKVPSNIIDAYPQAIINIHPALLPKYGGKGMYGDFVHRAVIEAGEKESGITIHYVNENYDEGDIIFQIKCDIEENDTAEDLANKIHRLEYKYFPEIIKTLLD